MTAIDRQGSPSAGMDALDAAGEARESNDPGESPGSGRLVETRRTVAP
jgi:hypothetical protein